MLMIGPTKPMNGGFEAISVISISLEFRQDHAMQARKKLKPARALPLTLLVAAAFHFWFLVVQCDTKCSIFGCSAVAVSTVTFSHFASPKPDHASMTVAHCSGA